MVILKFRELLILKCNYSPIYYFIFHYLIWLLFLISMYSFVYNAKLHCIRRLQPDVTSATFIVISLVKFLVTQFTQVEMQMQLYEMILSHAIHYWHVSTKHLVNMRVVYKITGKPKGCKKLIWKAHCKINVSNFLLSYSMSDC